MHNPLSFYFKDLPLNKFVTNFAVANAVRPMVWHPVNLSRASPLLDSHLYSIRDQCMIYKDWHTLYKDSLNQHMLEGLSGLDTSIYKWFNKFQPHLKFIYFWF